MSTLHRVRVDLGVKSYDVVVGRGAIRELASVIPADVKRVALVTQTSLPIDVRAELPAEVTVSRHLIGDGEQHKSLATIERLGDEFAAAGITRNDVVVGLVGMIDAAIGGKTGVNIAAGKNLVGAFWQPAGVICDTAFLDTLPEREQRCGHGEMAKYHFLTGDDLLALDLDARVARCVKIKADIVGVDERESGRRAVLNYGHTLAHALEIATEFSMAHGEAVAIGMMFAAHLAQALGRIDAARVAQHRTVIADHYRLNIKPPKGVQRVELIELMHHDKKAVDGLTFVLDGPNGIETVRNVDIAAVHQALDALSVP
ncbi:MAG: 3-dehydroquinate synthase [Actinobacteria bacterium]|nr:3-dehydroquinate synthase [Actinomycetota bacterium]